MRSNKVNLMNNRAVFYEEGSSGPEAHSNAYREVYQCFCDDYEPTTKDHTVIGVSAGKKTVTITIRNAYQEFKPQYHHSFELQSGYFKGAMFNIAEITPHSDNPQFLKLVGESSV